MTPTAAVATAVDGVIMVVRAGRFENPEERAYGRVGGERIPLYRVRLMQRDLWPDYEGADGDSLVLEIYHHWLRPA